MLGPKLRENYSGLNCLTKSYLVRQNRTFG